MPAAQPLAAVRDFLGLAAHRGEQSIATTRVILVVLFFVNNLVFNVVLGGEDGPRRFLVSGVGYAIGIGWSLWTLARLKAEAVRFRDLMVSVAVDGAVVGIALLPTVLWPDDGYRGVLLMPAAAMFLIAATAGGIRLSRRVAVYGAVLMTATITALVTLDLVRNADIIAYTGQDAIVWALLLSGSGLIGYVVAARTKRLVFDGADAALKAERARQRLGVYVSEEVAAEALESEALAPGGQRQQVAVLFSDLRGFTTYSEKLSPERLVSELNAYLDVMVQVIRQEGGVVDKFIGDAIMVVFGIPRSKPDDALRALRTVAAMERALAEHNQQRAEDGRPPMRHGIGVHYGPVVAGNIGNPDRLQYTVVGDVVNIASRLESSTKLLKLTTVLSADVVDAARAAGGDLPLLESIGAIDIRGRLGTVEAFTLAIE